MIGRNIHKVQTLKFDIHCQSKENALEIQPLLSNLVAKKIIAMTDEIFSKLANSESTFQIDRLEIDLGGFSIKDFQDDFVSIYKKELGKQLMKILSDSSNYQKNGVVEIDTSKVYLQLLCQFLLGGLMRWRGVSNYVSLNDVILEVLYHHSNLFERWLRYYGQYNICLRKRLVRQFEEKELEKTVDILEPVEGVFIKRYATHLDQIETPTPINMSIVKWDFIFTYLLVERGSFFNKKTFVKYNLHQISQHYNLDYWMVISSFSKELENNTTLQNTDAKLVNILVEISHEDLASPLTEYVNDQEDLRCVESFLLGRNKDFILFKKAWMQLVRHQIKDLIDLLDYYFVYADVRFCFVSELKECYFVFFIQHQFEMLYPFISKCYEQAVLMNSKFHIEGNEQIFSRSLRSVILDFLYLNKGCIDFNATSFVHYILHRVFQQYDFNHQDIIEYIGSSVSEVSQLFDQNFSYKEIVSSFTSDLASKNYKRAEIKEQDPIELVVAFLIGNHNDRLKFRKAWQDLYDNHIIFLIDLLNYYLRHDDIRHRFVFILDEEYFISLIRMSFNKKAQLVICFYQQVILVISRMKDVMFTHSFSQKVRQVILDFFYSSHGDVNFHEKSFVRLSLQQIAYKNDIAYQALLQSLCDEFNVNTLGTSSSISLKKNLNNILKEDIFGAEDHNVCLRIPLYEITSFLLGINKNVKIFVNGWQTLENDHIEVLKDLLGYYLRYPDVRYRFIYSLNKEFFVSLIQLVFPSESPFILDYYETIIRMNSILDKKRNIRLFSFSVAHVILDSLWQNRGSFNHKRFIRYNLKQMARQCDMEYSEVIQSVKMKIGVSSCDPVSNIEIELGNVLFDILVEDHALFQNREECIQVWFDVVVSFLLGKEDNILLFQKAWEGLLNGQMKLLQEIFEYYLPYPNVRHCFAYNLESDHFLVLIYSQFKTESQFIKEYYEQVIHTSFIVGDSVEDHAFAQSVRHTVLDFLYLNRGSKFNDKEFVHYTLQKLAHHHNKRFHDLLDIFYHELLRLNVHGHLKYVSQLLVEISYEIESPLKDDVSEIITFFTYGYVYGKDRDSILRMLLHLQNNKEQWTRWIAYLRQKEWLIERICLSLYEDELNDFIINLLKNEYGSESESTVTYLLKKIMKRSLRYRCIKYVFYTKVIIALVKKEEIILNDSINLLPLEKLSNDQIFNLLLFYNRSNLIQFKELICWIIFHKKDLLVEWFVCDKYSSLLIDEIVRSIPETEKLRFIKCVEKRQMPMIEKEEIIRKLNRPKLQVREVDTSSFEEEFFTENIYISNAGLVLLAPFFPLLFERLGFLSKQVFSGKEQAEKAIHILQYLVNGCCRSPEYTLVLNKQLCGVKTGKPIIKEYQMNKEELKITEGLLKHVISTWRGLGKTSIEGFKESFLQRDGVLDLKDNAWYLRVEAKPYDMLLDVCPWSFRTIKYPWMDRVIYIDWR
ncbi:hypothetical protein K4L44_00235 [Halosquirtibacter laminarini]|uniref:Uncharacterized protein n=1 Tax=Halosquirtibacter laminarini TaxID=3374600 RepID=A0AC61NPK2_9BACT|nr:hypothetical protein K4L44_00235 [Prolixibacteraceae bacterium]